MIIIFQIKDKIITHNEGVVVEEVVEDMGVIRTDMTIITNHTIMNMKEGAEYAEETGGATGNGVGIWVVVEAEVDAKMTTHRNNKGVGIEEDVGVIVTDMTIITDHTITNMKEVAEDVEETEGAAGARVEVTGAMVDRMGIGVVVESKVDTKMGACSK